MFFKYTHWTSSHWKFLDLGDIILKVRTPKFFVITIPDLVDLVESRVRFPQPGHPISTDLKCALVIVEDTRVISYLRLLRPIPPNQTTLQYWKSLPFKKAILRAQYDFCPVTKLRPRAAPISSNDNVLDSSQMSTFTIFSSFFPLPFLVLAISNIFSLSHPRFAPVCGGCDSGAV